MKFISFTFFICVAIIKAAFLNNNVIEVNNKTHVSNKIDEHDANSHKDNIESYKNKTVINTEKTETKNKSTEDNKRTKLKDNKNIDSQVINIKGNKGTERKENTIDETISMTEEDSIFVVKNIRCSMKNCQSPSFCLDSSTCKCGDGNANINIQDNPANTIYCQYKQKQLIVAFLLEIFVSAGVGHIYAGRVGFGLIKFLAFVLPCVFICCSGCVKQGQTICFTLSVGLTCTYIVWQIVDIVNFATNSYNDGNGVPLMTW